MPSAPPDKRTGGSPHGGRAYQRRPASVHAKPRAFHSHAQSLVSACRGACCRYAKVCRPPAGERVRQSAVSRQRRRMRCGLSLLPPWRRCRRRVDACSRHAAFARRLTPPRGRRGSARRRRSRLAAQRAQCRWRAARAARRAGCNAIRGRSSAERQSAAAAASVECRCACRRWRLPAWRKSAKRSGDLSPRRSRFPTSAHDLLAFSCREI